MHSLKVVFNEGLEIIRSIHITFYGDDQVYSFPEGSDNIRNPTQSGDTYKLIQFSEGEHLTGRIIMSENGRGTLAYIKFNTSMNRKFEAGKQLWYNIDQVF